VELVVWVQLLACQWTLSGAPEARRAGSKAVTMSAARLRGGRFGRHD